MGNTFDRPLLFSHEHRTLGAGMNIIEEDALEDEHYLVIPPPPPGVVRWVDVVEGAGCILGGEGGIVSGITQIQKDGVFYTFGNIANVSADQGAALPLAADCPLVLLPEDSGLFFEVTQGGGEGGDSPGVRLFGRWYDVRGVERQTTVLRTGHKMSILPEVEADNEALKIACDQQGNASVFFLNRDSVAHTIRAYASDGVVEIPLLLRGIEPAVEGEFESGLLSPLKDPQTAWGSFAQGWSLRVELMTAVVTKAPEVIAAFVRTNASPVKTNQGGAF